MEEELEAELEEELEAELEEELEGRIRGRLSCYYCLVFRSQFLLALPGITCLLRTKTPHRHPVVQGGCGNAKPNRLSQSGYGSTAPKKHSKKLEKAYPKYPKAYQKA